MFASYPLLHVIKAMNGLRVRRRLTILQNSKRKHVYKVSDDFQPGKEFPDVQECTAYETSKIRFKVRKVRSSLKKLDPCKATGPDQIPAKVLKM